MDPLPIPEPPPIPPEPVKKSSPLAGIIIAFLFLALIGLIFYQQLQIQKLTQTKPTITPTLSPTPPPDPTANWKTYTNNAYSFKYPSDWTLNDLTGGAQIEVYYQPDKTKSVGAILIEKSIQIPGDISQYTIEKQIGNVSSNCKLDPSEIKNWCYMSDSKLSFLITKDQDPAYNVILDQILSTFTFIDSQSVIPESINTIFTTVNQAFGSTITPIKENEFYALTGSVNKESWKLDVTDLLQDKQQFTVLRNTLERVLKQDINSAADGMGQSVQGYENDNVYCFSLLGFNNSHSISCAMKE